MTLDARRAIYFPEFALLAVADLHLGYAWVQRRRGALLPVSAPETIPRRLADLLADYPARELVVLGDLVHQAVDLPAVEHELRDLAAQVGSARLTLCLGNHDRRLETLLAQWAIPCRVLRSVAAGRCLLHHGDGEPAEPEFRLEVGARIQVIGHEHPALRLGDGVATSAKAPCFLVSDDTVIVPAFSDWAAGCVYGRSPFLGPIARRARFHSAFACLGSRLLRIPL